MSCFEGTVRISGSPELQGHTESTSCDQGLETKHPKHFHDDQREVRVRVDGESQGGLRGKVGGKQGLGERACAVGSSVQKAGQATRGGRVMAAGRVCLHQSQGDEHLPCPGRLGLEASLKAEEPACSSFSGILSSLLYGKSDGDC